MGKISRVKEEVKLKAWSEKIQQCKSSGLTVAQWRENNSFNIKTYYYRLKKVRESLSEIKECHEIVPVYVHNSKPQGQIIIEAHGIRAELSGNISPELLTALMGSLKC